MKRRSLWIDDCFQSTYYMDDTLSISHSKITLYMIKNWVDSDVLNFKSKRSVWNVRQKSSFIESLVVGFPISAVYIYEDSSGIKTIIDGYKRIDALIKYMNNRYVLTGMTYLERIENRFFDELSYNVQRKLLDSVIDFCIINPNCTPAVRYDIFKRVNNGKKNLCRDYIRLYSNYYTRNFLSRLSDKIYPILSYHGRLGFDFEEFVLIWITCVVLLNNNCISYHEEYLANVIDWLNKNSSRVFDDIQNDFNYYFQKACSLYDEYFSCKHQEFYYGIVIIFIISIVCFFKNDISDNYLIDNLKNFILYENIDIKEDWPNLDKKHIYNLLLKLNKYLE